MELEFMELDFHLKRHYRAPRTQLQVWCNQTLKKKKKKFHGTQVLGSRVPFKMPL